MKFEETSLRGAYLIHLEPIKDERGFFARSWCQDEFEKNGLEGNLTQCSISFNTKKSTLRGMHYQTAPHEETKLVRCTRGAMYDVIVDLRSDSPTFKQWFAAELTAENHLMMYVPKGFAHGLQTLEDNTEAFYQISEKYFPQSAAGVRWNDPAFGIKWPMTKPILSQKDCEYADFAC
jgi:dTDP-4-dehydrorhamnose 3,5-epimerase